MKCDAEIITRIQAAMKRKGLNQSQLAKAIGYHRSSISLLLKGKTPNIDDDLIDLLNDALGADVAPSGKRHELPSPLALDLSRLAKKDVKIAHLLETLIDVVSPEIKAFLPHVDTKKLPKIGAEVTKIVMRWEEGTDPHYSKIAVEVLDYLRDFYTKEAKSAKS
jgi:transcriptional regulator with XRE-family HTH domain